MIGFGSNLKVLQAVVVVTDLVKTMSGDRRRLTTIQPKNFTFLCELNLVSVFWIL
ncbi:hypothetical protein Syun_023562 [Stephania yunnanensis]|uniref:Uncharacterized protein n=1 Tax=Stephania yunnanensis TaxID=152371 RepID=A0AAP0I3E1_9MAGN